MSKFWVDNIRATLEVLEGNCKRLPAGERLEVKDLNEILELFDKSKALFLLQCELQGFSTEIQKDK